MNQQNVSILKALTIAIVLRQRTRFRPTFCLKYFYLRKNDAMIRKMKLPKLYPLALNIHGNRCRYGHLRFDERFVNRIKTVSDYRKLKMLQKCL